MMSELDSLVQQAEKLVDDRMHGMGMSMEDTDMKLIKDEIAELRLQADSMPVIQDEETSEYNPAVKNVLRKINTVVSHVDTVITSVPSFQDVNLDNGVGNRY